LLSPQPQLLDTVEILQYQPSIQYPGTWQNHMRCGNDFKVKSKVPLGSSGMLMKKPAKKENQAICMKLSTPRCLCRQFKQVPHAFRLLIVQAAPKLKKLSC
jgi:hypothetical protein